MKRIRLIFVIGVLLLTACTLPEQGGEKTNQDFANALADEANKEQSDETNNDSTDEYPVTDPEVSVEVATATDLPPTETALPPVADGPASGSLLYETDFNNLDGWAWFPWWKSDVHSYTDDYKAKIAKYEAIIVQGERFRIQIPKLYTNFAAYQQNPLSSPDVRITSEAIITSPRPWAYIGTICRYSADGWYEIFILLDGYWGIMKVSAVDGTYFDTEMLIYEETSEVEVGEQGDIYLLDSTCRGNTLSLTVNGVFLGSVEDESFMESSLVGLSVAAGEIGNTLIDFENFRVSVP